MGRFGKRRNESSHEDVVCSPRKQVKGKEVIPNTEINVGKCVMSGSEDSDSDVAEEIFSKLRSKRHDNSVKETEEHDSDDSSENHEADSDAESSDNNEDDDHGVSDDDDDNSDDDGDDDEEETDNDSNEEMTDDHKIKTESAKVKLTKGNKNILENEKDEGNMSDSSEECSDSSASDDSSDDEEVVNKSKTTENATSKLKVTSLKQKEQPHMNRKNVIESSDDSASDDSSINDDDEKVANIEDKIVLNTNSGIGKSSKNENVNSVGTDSNESSDESDDESDDDNDEILTGKSDLNSIVAQDHNKPEANIQVKQDIKGKAQDSLQESDSSDSDDDDSDDNDDASIKDDDNNVAENDESEDEFAKVKKELADMPLEDLMKIKEKLGLKMFNRIMHGNKFEEKKQKVFKRENKNRPMEISAKRRVPVLRNAMVPKEKVRRDPRFDDLSGEFEDKHFMRNYAFLDGVKQKEKLLVQKKLKKTKDEDKKKELSKLLNRMNQQEQLEQKKRHRMEMEQQWKEKEKQLVKEGKTPYFLKNSDKKKLELAEKYKELQKSGKVDNYMSKKMKKNAQKEKKKLPGRHERYM